MLRAGPVLSAWLLAVGVDFLLHGGLLARLYARESPFLLPAGEAFARIPLGYAAFLVLTIGLAWLIARLGARGGVAGFRVGVAAGAVVWGALALGLVSISTISWELATAWWLGQALELGASGAVLGAAARALDEGRSTRGVHGTVGAAVLACVMLTLALQVSGFAPPMERAGETVDAGAPLLRHGGLAAVDEPWANAKMRCDACHGAGPPPDWAADPAAITRVTLRRSVGGYGPPFVTKRVAFTREGRVTRELEVVGEVPSGGVGSFGADVASAREEGELPAAEWTRIAGVVAASRAFRFEGEAVVSFGTHGEDVFVFVEREGRERCVLGIMCVGADVRHPTALGVVAGLEACEARIDWGAPR